MSRKRRGTGYLPLLPLGVAIVLLLLFGFGASAHVLASSAEGDPVRLEQIGTSAAIVNGSMFLVTQSARIVKSRFAWRTAGWSVTMIVAPGVSES